MIPSDFIINIKLSSFLRSSLPFKEQSWKFLLRIGGFGTDNPFPPHNFYTNLTQLLKNRTRIIKSIHIECWYLLSNNYLEHNRWDWPAIIYFWRTANIQYLNIKITMKQLHTDMAIHCSNTKTSKFCEIAVAN